MELFDDKERERVKADPLSVASEIAWEASENIAHLIVANDGVFNGRLAAMVIDAAIAKARKAGS